MPFDVLPRALCSLCLHRLVPTGITFTFVIASSSPSRRHRPLHHQVLLAFRASPDATNAQIQDNAAQSNPRFSMLLQAEVKNST